MLLEILLAGIHKIGRFCFGGAESPAARHRRRGAGDRAAPRFLRGLLLLAATLGTLPASAQVASIVASGRWNVSVYTASCGYTEFETFDFSFASGSYSANVSVANSRNAGCGNDGLQGGVQSSFYASAQDLLTTSQFPAFINALSGGQTTVQTVIFPTADSFSATVTEFDGRTATVTGTRVTTSYTLSAGVSGSGTITSSTGGINCGATCSASLANATIVTLTATPASGSAFSGWAGACSGTGTCTLTMDAAKTVTATFRTVPFTTTPTTSITATSATISNRISFNSADVGKSGAVFVTAMAPSGSLAAAQVGTDPESRATALAATGGDDSLRHPAAAATTTSLVLIQLTPSGWQKVTGSQLTPYATGVLGDQLALQSILNSANAANLKGAQFCVGYGTSATEMIAAGRMQLVASIADGGSVVSASGSCVVAVQSGWWWNPAESGRGFFFETSGSTAFLASYLYAADGRATWYASVMQQSDGVFAGTLDAFSSGQSLTGSYRAPSASSAAGGSATVTITDSTHGTLGWAGTTTPIERLTFADNSNPPAFQPQPGWWWYASESGRGFSIEVQGSSMFLAGYMYETSGNPIWYLSIGTLSGQTYTGSWSQYANGQTLGGAYKAASLANAAVGTLTIQFSSAVAGVLTLPDGRQIPIERFRF